MLFSVIGPINCTGRDGRMNNNKRFLEEYLKLCEKYNRCVKSCCMTAICKLDSCVTFDDEGEELLGIDAHRHELEKE